MSDGWIWLGVTIWYAVGVAGHVYWVLNKYDYTSEYLLTSALSGFVGPLSFWIGWTVYGDVPKARVLWRKRS